MHSRFKKTPKIIKGLGRTLKKTLLKNPERFLKDVSGVVHIGANTGQERKMYNDYGLKVIWVEPIPDVFQQLKKNIQQFENQRAFQALITDVDDKQFEFHIANNNGASSSIFQLKYHKDIWPKVKFQRSISLSSLTLPTLCRKAQIDLSNYQALIIDTQGSELLVLKGSLPILKNFKYVKSEVADFESYEDSCNLSEMVDFMSEHGYREYSRNKFAKRDKGGSYFDVVFEKID